MAQEDNDPARVLGLEDQESNIHDFFATAREILQTVPVPQPSPEVGRSAENVEAIAGNASRITAVGSGRDEPVEVNVPDVNSVGGVVASSSVETKTKKKAKKTCWPRKRKESYVNWADVPFKRRQTHAECNTEPIVILNLDDENRMEKTTMTDPNHLVVGRPVPLAPFDPFELIAPCVPDPFQTIWRQEKESELEWHHCVEGFDCPVSSWSDDRIVEFYMGRNICPLVPMMQWRLYGHRVEPLPADVRPQCFGKGFDLIDSKECSWAEKPVSNIVWKMVETLEPYQKSLYHPDIYFGCGCNLEKHPDDPWCFCLSFCTQFRVWPTRRNKGRLLVLQKRVPGMADPEVVKVHWYWEVNLRTDLFATSIHSPKLGFSYRARVVQELASRGYRPDDKTRFTDALDDLVVRVRPLEHVPLEVRSFSSSDLPLSSRSIRRPGRTYRSTRRPSATVGAPGVEDSSNVERENPIETPLITEPTGVGVVPYSPTETPGDMDVGVHPPHSELVQSPEVIDVDGGAPSV